MQYVRKERMCSKRDMSIKTMVYQASTFYSLCYISFVLFFTYLHFFRKMTITKVLHLPRVLTFYIRTYINRRRPIYHSFFTVVYILLVSVAINCICIHTYIWEICTCIHIKYFIYILYSFLTERAFYDNPLVYIIHTYVRTYIHTAGV